jgi:hypothetical protein
VPLDVKPESGPQLAMLLERIREEQDDKGNPDLPNFARIIREVPSAHFLSMSLFAHAAYDPFLIIEANFDGEPGPFWAQFEAAIGTERLREVLGCCKCPGDGTAALHAAVTRKGASAPVALYLERRSHRPSVFHHGNRGLTRDRILLEQALALAIERELDGHSPDYRAMEPVAIHAALRGRLVERFPWLEEPAQGRLGPLRGFLDWVRLGLFASLVLAALILPGALLWAAVGPALYGGVVAIVTAVAIAGLGREKSLGLRGILAPIRGLLSSFSLQRAVLALALAALVGLGAVCMLFLLPTLAHLLLRLLGRPEAGSGLGPLFRDILGASAWGLLGLIALLPGLALWLRYLERRDSSHDGPRVDERTLAEIVRREDRVVQNHMASIVLLRSGILRSVIARAGHLGLHLVLRAFPGSRDGYLQSMRTVHFAHWAFLNNGSRLLFVSNFDHSWSSYLDDFIEKAAEGLTLAWCCGVGFPLTRWLVRGGAADGRRFKAWALASRAVSHFWYSAYPNLTVDRIERHAAIANGLRAVTLTEQDARKWLLLL